MDLRPYQLDAVEQLRQLIRGGAKRPLLVMPTGGGKTVAFAHIISRAVELGKRALVLAHRRELIGQASNKLLANGVPHGIIQGGSSLSLQRPVQVASVQALANKADRLTRVDLIVVDEAHHVTEKNGYGRLLERWPNAIVLGVTATPWRLDGRGLGDVFDGHVIGSTPRQLRDDGFLVPVGGWEYEGIDTSSARVSKGDFVAKDLAASASSRRVVGDVVSEWERHANGARTVLFALSVEHSQTMAEAFRKAGIAAEHVDGEMATADRDAVLARLRAGVTRVVSNCNVLTEGFDLPELEVCILARPTLSLSLYLQMVGRVLRPAEGKTMARIHDHAGCLAAHGHPYAERDYSPTVSVRGDRKKAGGGAGITRRCPACKSVWARWPCDGCGYSPKPAELQLEYEEAARKREIQHDGVAPKAVEADTPEGRRKRWVEKYAETEKKYAFFLRMLEKHGPQKARRVYWWFTGNSEWPPATWLSEAGRDARIA